MKIIKIILKWLKRFNDWGNSIEYNKEEREYEIFERRI